jgi:hypothetical protein
VALIFGFTAWCLWCLALSACFVFRIKKVVWALAAVQAALVKKNFQSCATQIHLLKFFPDVAILFHPRNLQLKRKEFLYTNFVTSACLKWLSLGIPGSRNIERFDLEKFSRKELTNLSPDNVLKTGIISFRKCTITFDRASKRKTVENRTMDYITH